MPKLVLCVLLLVVSFAALTAQELQTRPEGPAAPTGPAKAPNSEPTYQQLRRVQLGNESVPANGMVLHRDAGTFTLQSGTICFLAPVNGKVTGAVFSGFGTFAMTPPTDMEKRSLSLLTKAPSITEEFNELVLRFTDNTYDEMKKGAAGGTASGSCPAGLLSDSQDVLRKKVHFNLTARILQDVLSEKPGGLFVAFIHGRKYDNKLIYAVDPHGAPDMGFLDVAPEEVELLTYDDAKYGIWSAFHRSNEYARGTATGTEQNGWIHIVKHQLDSRIEKNGRLNGRATTTFVSQADGLRVVPFHLFHTLRVDSVTAANGEPLHFIQAVAVSSESVSGLNSLDQGKNQGNSDQFRPRPPLRRAPRPLIYCSKRIFIPCDRFSEQGINRERNREGTGNNTRVSGPALSRLQKGQEDQRWAVVAEAGTVMHSGDPRVVPRARMASG